MTVSDSSGLLRPLCMTTRNAPPASPSPGDLIETICSCGARLTHRRDFAPLHACPRCGTAHVTSCWHCEGRHDVRRARRGAR